MGYLPTEKEGAKTTKIELDVPPGFAVDSYQPAPGWKRQVVAKGSGENAVVSKVIWTGGSTPTDPAATAGRTSCPRSSRRTRPCPC